MKTTLISLSTATLTGLASYATGHAFGAAEFTAVLFATGLVAWTIEQYSRQPLVLTAVRPLRLPVRLNVQRLEIRTSRLAA